MGELISLFKGVNGNFIILEAKKPNLKELWESNVDTSNEDNILELAYLMIWRRWVGIIFSVES